MIEAKLALVIYTSSVSRMICQGAGGDRLWITSGGSSSVLFLGIGRNVVEIFTWLGAKVTEITAHKMLFWNLTNMRFKNYCIPVTVRKNTLL